MIRMRDGKATITVYVDERDFAQSMPSDHPHFEKVDALVQQFAARDDQGESLTDEENDELLALFQVEKTVNDALDRLSERYHVKSGVLYKDNDPLDNASPWVKQVLRFRDEGVLDWAPLIRYQENLDANPNQHSRDQLFSHFLANYPVTITEDGMLVLYKGVQHRDPENDDDLYIFQSTTGGPNTIVDDEVQPNGYIKQGIGSVVEHPRSKVHFDPSRACSNGLHCGTYAYASRYGNVVLRVIVNPRDVVNVPNHDHKVRVCRYVVDGLAVAGEYQEAVLVQQRNVVDDGVSAVTRVQDPGDPVPVPAEATYDGQEGQDTGDDVYEAQNASDHAIDCPGCDDCLDVEPEESEDGDVEDADHEPLPMLYRGEIINQLDNNQEVTPVTTAAPKAARKRYPSPAKWAELVERKTRRRKSIASLAPDNWVQTGDDPNERKSWEVTPR